MEQIIQNKLQQKVKKWRDKGYPCEFPVIREILDFAFVESERGERILGYLRKAQLEALETYWYLRVVEKTPHIIELYKRMFDDNVELLKALGIKLSNEDLIRLLPQGGIDSIFDKIINDDNFVKKNKLEVVRESLTINYPSYILALAMGTGKTVLIGTIIATEFAMALEYTGKFVRNALVFAPGKTILGALKEISDIPFKKILPPRFYKQFMTSMKITYTRDKEKTIPITFGSSFNIIVTNTEKIRIQKFTRKKRQHNLLNYINGKTIQETDEIANLRLQTIASLPNLAIFSDEAHHTYGQSLDKELKKVRKTVDYLADNTNVIAVINTTGTPYYKKQMLRDVVYWYGLSQGISDGILKEVENSIYSYDDITSENFLRIVLEDFFSEYNAVKIYTGALAKIAIYFPQTEDLKKYRPLIEKTILDLGLDPGIILEVHNKSDEETKDLFNNRINEAKNPFRVYLLVNMGTEGWNCLSLFATALARKLKTSNNFVLQAASRCLRQIPNNTKKARIYLSKDNVRVLDNQLRETFGETLQILDMTKQDVLNEKLLLRKLKIPPIQITKRIKTVIPNESQKSKLKLVLPKITKKEAIKTTYSPSEQDNQHILSERQIESIKLPSVMVDIYEVTNELARIYRLKPNSVYKLLSKLYPEGNVDFSHINHLRQQIENQIKDYEIVEEDTEVALALIKLDGFDKEEVDGKISYFTEIIFHKEKVDLLLDSDSYKKINPLNFGFHYSPYNMDSCPEKDFFLKLLQIINQKPSEIQDIYFTGALTDAKKTDFLFEYKDKNGKWRLYIPDFLLRKTDGKILIVEVKGEVFRDPLKEMAIKQLESLNPEDLKYEILLTNNQMIGFENFKKITKWIYGE